MELDGLRLPLCAAASALSERQAASISRPLAGVVGFPHLLDFASCGQAWMVDAKIQAGREGRSGESFFGSPPFVAIAFSASSRR